MSQFPRTGGAPMEYQESDDHRAIREGVGHDGRGLGLPMWWWAFRALSDEDLAAIVVYLRSLPAVVNALPPRILSAERERERAEAPQPLAGPIRASAGKPSSSWQE